MRAFDVLVVDDDESITELVKGHFRDRTDIRVHLASTAQDAMSIIEANFLHLALVDMQLRPNTADGMGVFNYLCNHRPSCTVILLTAYPEEYRKELFTLLNPRFPQVRGALDKADFSTSAPTVIEECANGWLRNGKNILGVDEIARQLGLKNRSGKVEVTSAEVDFILSRILGQGEDAKVQDGLATEERCSDLLMNTIKLNELKGGRSRSVVTAGRPIDNAGNLGIWCVMKVGPRQEIEQEFSRYRSYVHFSVALAHRVELLGHAFGDTCGAVCYSFAGKSPDTVRTLYEVFTTEEDTSPYLKQMFALQNRELYGRTGLRRSLAEYFNRSYALEPRSIRKTAEELRHKLRHSATDSSSELEQLDLEPINKAITNAVMQKPFDTCIVHGDMNAGNVVVAEDGRVIYIDYARSGCGPRAVDFAALEASVRLATCPSSVRSVLASSKQEDSLWRKRWRGSTEAASSQLYWARVSEMLSSHARENFQDLSEAEYAATCFLWGARLFRVTQISAIERLRILIWMLCCAEHI